MMDILRLKQLAGVSKIEEVITVLDLDRAGIDSTTLKDGVDIFKVDGYLVKLFKVAHQDAYIAYDGEEVVASVVFDRNTHSGNEYYTLSRAYTEPKYRGAGIAIKITLEAKKATGFSILSDEELTNDGYRMWINLSKAVNHIKVYSHSTGDIRPLAGNEELLKDGDRYVFLWERKYTSNRLNCDSIFKSNEFMLVEKNGVLRDI